MNEEVTFAENEIKIERGPMLRRGEDEEKKNRKEGETERRREGDAGRGRQRGLRDGVTPAKTD